MNKLKILLLGSIVAFGMTGTAMSMESNQDVKDSVARQLAIAYNNENRTEGQQIYDKIASAISKNFNKVIDQINTTRETRSVYEYALALQNGVVKENDIANGNGSEPTNEAFESFKEERIPAIIESLNHKQKLKRILIYL